MQNLSGKTLVHRPSRWAKGNRSQPICAGCSRKQPTLQIQPRAVSQAAKVERTHLWNHQTKMGLQPHQPQRIKKSKWGDGFDNDSLQHQAVYYNSGYRRFDNQNQQLDSKLQSNCLAFSKNDLIKQHYSLLFYSTKVSCLKNSLAINRFLRRYCPF